MINSYTEEKGPWMWSFSPDAPCTWCMGNPPDKKKAFNLFQTFGIRFWRTTDREQEFYLDYKNIEAHEPV